MWSVSRMIRVSKSTSSIIIFRVTQSIAQLVCQHICFPATAQQCSDVMHGFYSITSFPGVFGTVDCTYITPQYPGGECRIVPQSEGILLNKRAGSRIGRSSNHECGCKMAWICTKCNDRSQAKEFGRGYCWAMPVIEANRIC